MKQDPLARRRSRFGKLRHLVGAGLLTVGCGAGMAAMVVPGQTIPAPDSNKCTHSLPYPGGVCPKCGICVWYNNKCTFRGKRNLSTCPCYEGQTQACTKPGGGAGTQTCIGTSSTSAYWGTCS